MRGECLLRVAETTDRSLVVPDAPKTSSASRGSGGPCGSCLPGVVSGRWVAVPTSWASLLPGLREAHAPSVSH